MRKKLLLFILYTLYFILYTSSAYAVCEVHDYSNSEDFQKAIGDCQKEIDARLSAHNKNKADLANLEKNLKRIRKLIKSAEVQIKKTETKIFNNEVDLEYQREIFNRRVKNYYMRSRYYSPFLLFLSSINASKLIRELGYRQVVANRDRKIILDVSQNLKQLINDKKKIKANEDWLVKTKSNVEKQAGFLKKEVEKVEGYFTEVNNKIAELSAKQKALLAAKTETFQTSVGEVPAADDPHSRPDYDPGFRPAFAAFSFGAPHRKGMSQYGALGRAKAGQNYEQILRSYYGDVRIEKRDFPETISTAVGNLSFEGNYLMGIAEMPSRWGDEGGYEALKAQAVAARSYAVKAGKPICVNEHCQVYHRSKAANPPDAWRRAVNDTRGMVIVSNQSNDVVSAWYASTSGGYVYSYSSVGHTTPGLWDTSCGNRSCWTNEAWEKKAGSPWFYKGWYKSRSGKSCGRSHPWLTQDEFADILNAVLVYSHDKNSIQHLSQIEAQSCWGETIPDTWSKDRLRAEAARYSGPISRINSIAVNYSGGGYTESIKFSTDRGDFSFSGDDFKFIFNLRAPGVIHLKSRLFNIEKK